MLNFDDTHKSIVGCLSDNKNKFRIRNFIINGLLITSIFLFSGCTKNKEEKTFYAYRVINNDSFIELVISDNFKEMYTDSTINYIKIQEEDKNLIEYERQEGLIRIDSNRNKIKEIISNQNEHIEYEYEFIWKQKVEHFVDGKKIATSYVPKTEYRWTTNSNEDNLTGNKRNVSYCYYGYKVVLDENNNYVTVRSDLFSNFKDLPKEFTYIKSIFYEKIITELKPEREDSKKSEVPNYSDKYKIKIKQNRM